MVKNQPALQKTQVPFLGQEDPLEKGIETHCSILAWRIPWTEEPVRLQLWGHKELNTTEWLTLSYNLPRLNNDKIENMDRLITRDRINNKNSLKKENPDQITSLVNSNKYFKKYLYWPSSNFSKKLKKMGHFQTHFYKTSIHLIPSQTIKKENYRPVTLINTNVKLLNKSPKNWIKPHIKKIIHHDKLTFTTWGQNKWRTNVFELWCWRRLLRVPWTARRSNQSILREINPDYTLERVMLKLQYFDYLMWRANSMEKTLMLGKVRAEGEEGNRE